VILFLILSADGECDAFVRALTSADALEYWKDYHKGRYDRNEHVEVITVPTANVVGVIPWDTLKVEDFDP
jgi:hypothetical protein